MNERNDIRPDNTSSSSSENSAPLGEHQPIEAYALALSAHGEESNADRKLITLLENRRRSGLSTSIRSLLTGCIGSIPLLFVMIYSGILIYWADSQHEGLNAHQVYRVMSPISDDEVRHVSIPNRSQSMMLRYWSDTLVQDVTFGVRSIRQSLLIARHLRIAGAWPTCQE